MSKLEDLAKRIVELEEQLAGLRRFENINKTLFQVSNAVSSTRELDDLYKAIHQALSLVIDTTNFYIALYRKDNDSLTFPYCVDTVDATYPPVIDVSKTSSLSAEVVRTGNPLLVSKKEMLAMRAQSVFMAPACSLSEIWLGVPLRTQDSIIGVMAVQSYNDPNRYTQADLEIMMSVADQVAAAIKNKRAEKALRESDERYSAVVMQASEGIYLLDPQTKKVIDANPSLLNMVGRDQSELGNLLVYDFVAHEKNEIDRIIEQVIIRHQQNGKSYFVGERTYLKPDGSLIYVEASATLLVYGDTKLLCVIVRNINERKLAEAALQESEQKHRRLIENATDAIFLTDEQGTILNVNQAACDSLGYTREEFQKLNVADLDEQHHDRELFKQFIKTLPNEQPLLFESLHRRKNGSFVPVEINTVTYLEKGTRYVLGVARDITERKKSEAALHASAERIRVFFSSINDAIFVHPLLEEGFAPFIEVNEIACQRYGYSRAEFLKMTALDITKKAQARQHAGKGYRKKLLEEEHLVVEAVHIKKNGDEFPVEINSNIVMQNGKPVILAVVRDITERKVAQAEREELESRLQQAQKLESIGRLAGGIAHDFNNMLSVIIGRSELAIEQCNEDSLIYEDLQQIKQAAEHSSELTRQLLAFARKQVVNPITLDLNEKLDGMLSMLRRLLGEEIELLLLPAKNLWPVKIDPNQMNQVLTNLCVNARDAISGPGKIIISTENITLPDKDLIGGFDPLQGKYVRITVSDTGKGIDPDDIPQIFEPFFTTKQVGQGTGLGLATVYGIIRQNKGFIDVESTLGEGTTFSIYLPEHLHNIAATAREGRSPEVKADKETILVVEDEPSILAMSKAILEKQGYRVIIAEGPSAAIKKAWENVGRINLLLTDVVMPEMNGRELANHLQSLYPNIKKLFMSGYAADTIAHHGISSNTTDFIEKPFSAKELSRRVRLILDSEKPVERHLETE